jgi:hypothetical protein
VILAAALSVRFARFFAAAVRLAHLCITMIEVAVVAAAGGAGSARRRGAGLAFMLPAPCDRACACPERLALRAELLALRAPARAAVMRGLRAAVPRVVSLVPAAPLARPPCRRLVSLLSRPAACSAPPF